MDEGSVKPELALWAEVTILSALRSERAPVAQLVEQETLNLLVVGSNPSGRTTAEADLVQTNRDQLSAFL